MVPQQITWVLHKAYVVAEALITVLRSPWSDGDDLSYGSIQIANISEQPDTPIGGVDFGTWCPALQKHWRMAVHE